MRAASGPLRRSSRGRPTTGPSISGIAQRWTESGCGAAGRRGSDKLLSLAAELDRAGFRELACGPEDLLLRRFHFGDAYRALRLQIVLEHLGGALRHVLVDLLLQRLLGALHRQHQAVAGDLAQQLLHAAIVEVDQVVE